MPATSRTAPLVFVLALVLGAGALWLALRDGEELRPARERAIAAEHTAAPRPALRDPESGALTGRLVDGHGAPRAGARVRAWLLPEVAYFPQSLLRRSLAPVLERETTTDADGLFVLDLSTAQRGHALLLIEEPGFAPIYAPALDLLGNRRRELGTLTLHEGGRLALRVQRRDGSAPGEPLRATVLQALEARAELALPFGRVEGVRALATEIDAASGTGILEALPRGRFVLALEPSRREAELVEEAGALAALLSAPFEIEVGRTTELEVLLDEGAPLELRVRDARGEPLAGARVTLHPSSEELPRALALSGRTDAEGRFATARAPRRGALRARVEAPGYQAAEREFDPCHARQVFLLQPEVELRGVVLEARTRRPIAEAWIGCFPADEEASKPLEVPTWATRALLPERSDASGRFALRGVGLGRWQVVARHGDYLLARSAPIHVQDGEAPAPIELELDPGIAIEVRLLAPEGRPLAEAGLSLHRAPRPGDEPTLEGRFAFPPRGLRIYADATDARGEASFRLLRPGSYRLHVKHRDWQAWPPFALELDAERPRERFELRLEEPGSWHGRVTLGGAPTRERRIFARHASGLVYEALPDEEGRYAIAGVPPGRYVLEPRESAVSLAQVAWEQFREPERETRAPEVARELLPGQALAVDFALEGTKLARVVGALGLDGRRYGVWLVPADLPLQGSLAQQRGTSTDAEGRFALVDVPFGSYRLVVTPAGASPLASADPRASAEQTFRSFEVGRALLVRTIAIDAPEVDLGVLAERTAPAAGTIVDAGGAPLGPGFVILRRAGFGAFRAEVDAGGRFDLGELPHGELELVLHVGDGAPVTRALRFAGEPLRVVL